MWIKGYVSALSEEKSFYVIIQKRFDIHGIKISKGTINNVVNRKGESRQSLQGKKTPKEYPKKVCTVSNLSKMKTLVIRKNPPIIGN